jgi:hypothetical protein
LKGFENSFDRYRLFQLSYEAVFLGNILTRINCKEKKEQDGPRPVAGSRPGQKPTQDQTRDTDLRDSDLDISEVVLVEDPKQRTISVKRPCKCPFDLVLKGKASSI